VATPPAIGTTSAGRAWKCAATQHVCPPRRGPGARGASEQVRKRGQTAQRGAFLRYRASQRTFNCSVCIAGAPRSARIEVRCSRRVCQTSVRTSSYARTHPFYTFNTTALDLCFPQGTVRRSFACVRPQSRLFYTHGVRQSPAPLHKTEPAVYGEGPSNRSSPCSPRSRSTSRDLGTTCHFVRPSH
jgi:hypothetical protein